jgi:guanylate kinase
VLAAPSGTGKTTIARILVEEHDDFVFSISATTRPPRPGELDGVDYHFVDRARFIEMIEAGEFAEWAEVHGRMYGTPRANLEAASARGESVVLDIDVQGAAQIAASVPGSIRLFILPPDAATMLARLGRRGTETEADVARRLRSALEELARVEEFHAVVVNDQLERAVSEIRDIARGVHEGAAPETESARIAALRADLQGEVDARAG